MNTSPQAQTTPPQLQRDQAIMVFFDSQTGLMASAESLHPELLKQATLALRDVAHIYRLPVILTASDPSNPQGPGPLLPQLTDAFPDSQVIARTSIGAWDDRRFVSAVETTHRRQLILSGIATDAGIAFTALGARRAGYDVFVVADATATWSAAAQSAALLRLSMAGVVPVSWIAVAAELQHDWSEPHSEDLAKLLQNNIARWNYIGAGSRALAGKSEARGPSH